MNRPRSSVRPGARRGSRGYTAVEVGLALTVLLISMAGVMSMQKASIQGNQDARRLDIANSIARVWLDRLATDATVWNANVGLNQTLWLKALLDTGFQTPTAQPAGVPVWSPAFDILGRDLPNVADPTAIYCVHVSVSTVSTLPAGGPSSVRATVLVFWPKNLLGAQTAPNNPLCPGPADVANFETGNPGTYHMLFTTEGLVINS